MHRTLIFQHWWPMGTGLVEMIETFAADVLHGIFLLTDAHAGHSRRKSSSIGIRHWWRSRQRKRRLIRPTPRVGHSTRLLAGTMTLLAMNTIYNLLHVKYQFSRIQKRQYWSNFMGIGSWRLRPTALSCHANAPWLCEVWCTIYMKIHSSSASHFWRLR